MKKIVTIFLFISQLFIGKTYADYNDSVALAKQYFNAAKYEIEQMLSGKDSLNYERAVFLTENAYWGNKYSYKLFNNLINFHALNISLFAETNRTKKANDFKSDFISTKEQKQKYYEKALYNWAIFKYLTDTMFIYDSDIYFHFPLKYSTTDPLGTLNWENSQVMNLLNPENNIGNCMAMTALFKIFSEKLNTLAYLGTAPGHIFIVQSDDKGIDYNVELATHSFPGAGSLMTLTYTGKKAVENGISMRTLNKKQSVALCLIYLAKGYEHKFNVKSDCFMLECAETALQYDSLNLNAMLLKAEVLETDLINMHKTIKQLQKDSIFLQYQNLLSSLLEKGYLQMTSEMKELIISKLRGIDIPFFAENHSPQPFQNIQLNKTERTVTLSGGLFDEDPQPKAIERNGKTIFNTKTKKIIEFKEPDSTFSNYPIDPVIFAWAIDPLAAKYPYMSPYAAFNNNPLYFKDPDGKSGEASIYLVSNQADADKYGVPINTSIILVKSTYIFYGDIKSETAQAVVKKMQDAWNNVDGKGYGSTVVDGKSYNVVFEIKAEIRTQEENESDGDLWARLAEEFFGEQTVESQNNFDPNALAYDIKNNFIAVYNLGTKSSKTATCNSGLWNSNEILTNTVLNESYHGYTGMPDQEYVPGNPRAANARGSGVDADSRIVTSQDINDIGLDILLSGGKSSAEVGYQSNYLYSLNQEQYFNYSAVKQKAKDYEKKLGRK